MSPSPARRAPAAPAAAASAGRADFACRPRLDSGAAGDLLDLLATVLSSIAEYRASLPTSTGKRKRRRAAREKQKAQEAAELNPKPSPPPILRYAVAGVNAVTAVLEAAVAQGSSLPPSVPAGEPPARLRAVFVCRADGHPTQLHAHFPVLCQLVKPPVKLLALPKGAESRLTERLGIPRLGVLGLLDGAPGADILFELIQSLPTVEVPWVSEKHEWQETRIKQLQTKPGAKKSVSKQKTDSTKDGDSSQAKRSKAK